MQLYGKISTRLYFLLLLLKRRRRSSTKDLLSLAFSHFVGALHGILSHIDTLATQCYVFPKFAFVCCFWQRVCVVSTLPIFLKRCLDIICAKPMNAIQTGYCKMKGWFQAQPLTPFETITLVGSLITIPVAFFSFNAQLVSSQQTARMEMLSQISGAFAEPDMFEAVDYFLQEFKRLEDIQTKAPQYVSAPRFSKRYDEALEALRNSKKTRKYQYEILTTLHQAEQLYQIEKEYPKLLTSLITPAIVEVTLSVFPKLDKGFTQGVDEPVYKMVYQVFEETRQSYLEPYFYAKKTEKARHSYIINNNAIQRTRRILQSLQPWDTKFGDEGDRILTELHLELLKEMQGLNKDRKETLKKLNSLDARFKGYEQRLKNTTKISRLSYLYFYRGVVKSDLEDNAGALKDCDKAIELNPNEARAYVNRGLVKSDLGRKKEALVDYDKAIELNPNEARAYFNRGIVKSDLGRKKEALADYDKAIELNPNEARVYVNRGNVKDDLGDKAGALKDYDKAIELNPNEARAYVNRGIVKSDLGRKKEALADYDKANELNPNDAKAYVNRGIVKSDLGRKKEALADYDKAIELNPNEARAYVNRGNVKDDLGDKAGALKDYDKAIELNPNEARAYVNRGILYQSMGEADKATQDFKKAKAHKAKGF
jgi:tetratricopeptide (TPR) repeat protein